MRRKTRKVETMDEVVKGIMAEGGRGGLGGFARQLVRTGRMLRLTVLRETTILTFQTGIFCIGCLVVRALTTIQRTTATLGNGRYLASSYWLLSRPYCGFGPVCVGKCRRAATVVERGVAASLWLLSRPLLLLVLLVVVVVVV
jgi:hypothetical protein